MGSAVEDETISINAIYEPGTLSQASPGSDVYLLKIPSTETVLRLLFPPAYPDDEPSILGPESSGAEAKKGAAIEIASLARIALNECFSKGEPCIFDLIEQTMAMLQEGSPQKSPEEAQNSLEIDEVETDVNHTQPHQQSSPQQIGPKWVISEVFTENKSTFVARATSVIHPDEARTSLAQLVSTDKKVAKATHNIIAWRIRGRSGVVYQDCDDDGEAAAGGRLLHLLQIMDVWNVMVVVSRWYGGVRLGPDRFRLINSAARDSLVKGGFDKK